MRYRVYGGPPGTESIKPIDKSRLPFKEFNSLEEALVWTRRVVDAGHVAHLIEGDDGTRLGKDDIAAAMHQLNAKAAETGRPA
jgi:hypothetical protein